MNLDLAEIMDFTVFAAGLVFTLFKYYFKLVKLLIRPLVCIFVLFAI